MRCDAGGRRLLGSLPPARPLGCQPAGTAPIEVVPAVGVVRRCVDGSEAGRD